MGHRAARSPPAVLHLMTEGGAQCPIFDMYIDSASLQQCAVYFQYRRLYMGLVLRDLFGVALHGAGATFRPLANQVLFTWSYSARTSQAISAPRGLRSNDISVLCLDYSS